MDKEQLFLDMIDDVKSTMKSVEVKVDDVRETMHRMEGNINLKIVKTRGVLSKQISTVKGEVDGRINLLEQRMTQMEQKDNKQSDRSFSWVSMVVASVLSLLAAIATYFATKPK
jgi:hypothetical protein